ncbi:hypothetical protein GTO27_03695, partial [Candidatus Bathyarchaeota archaeon]|nr:hypothetical protein [Candidatus Bathyarchaeota archaeon]
EEGERRVQHFNIQGNIDIGAHYISLRAGIHPDAVRKSTLISRAQLTVELIVPFIRARVLKKYWGK